MDSSIGKSSPTKAAALGIGSSLLVLAAIFCFFGAIVYAFASATYLGPILAAVLGLVVIVAGLVFVRTDGPGTSPAATAIVLTGMLLILVGAAGALTHAFHISF